MASTARVFFAGVATSVLLIGAGFGGGVALVTTAMDVPQKAPQTSAAPWSEKATPPERVVLPAMTDAAPVASEPASTQAAILRTAQPLVTPSQEPPGVSGQDQVEKQDLEKEKRVSRQAEAEKQQAERAAKKAADRERRNRRYVDRKARLEAARQQVQQQQRNQQQENSQNTERFGVLAFDRIDEPRQGFFGD